jgi:hypothetical protein
VRGYTLSELVALLELNGGLSVQCVKGVGFYPLPARLARPLANLFTAASHTPVVVARKERDLDVPPWQEYRQREMAEGVQTFYG